MTTCRAEYKWTADQLVDATWSHAKNSTFKNFQYIVFSAGLLSGFAGLAFWYTDLRNLSLPLVLLSLYTIFLRQPIQTWQIRRQFKSRKDQGLTISFEFNDKEIRIQSDQSQGTFPWSQYQAATKSKSGVVLYQDRDNYHWIPASSFPCPEDYQTFLALAKEKVPSFKVGR
jgi:hypothetical protein